METVFDKLNDVDFEDNLEINEEFEQVLRRGIETIKIKQENFENEVRHIWTKEELKYQNMLTERKIEFFRKMIQNILQIRKEIIKEKYDTILKRKRK